MPNTNAPKGDDRSHDDQLEQHSLPGMNQAGKPTGDAEAEPLNRDGTSDREEPGGPERSKRPADAPSRQQVNEHSLPGMNQAGKRRTV